MLYLRLSLAAFTLCWVLMSCQKEEILNSAVDATSLAEAQPKGVFGRNWQPDLTGGGDHRCPWPGNRCTRETFLVPNDGVKLKSVFTAIESGDELTIINAFQTEREVLLKYIEQHHFDEVVTGITRATTLWNLDHSTQFMIFGVGESPFVYEFPAN